MHVPVHRDCEEFKVTVEEKKGSSDAKKKRSFILRTDANQLEPETHAVIFLVVEVQELADYKHMLQEMGFRDSNTQKIRLVSIPGRGRGIGFARSMILLLWQALDCRGINLDQFFMLDDDLEAMRVFNGNTGVKDKASLTAALGYLQQAFVKHIAERKRECWKLLDFFAHQDYDQCGTLLDLYDEHFSGRKWNQFRQSFAEEEVSRALIEAFTNSYGDQDKFLAGAAKINQKFHEFANQPEGSNFLSEFFQQLDQSYKSKIFEVPLFSICPRGRNYLSGLKKLMEVNGTYRVSEQHHACILFYGPAIRGFSYLSNDDHRRHYPLGHELPAKKIPYLRALLLHLHKGDLKNYQNWVKEKLVDEIKKKLPAPPREMTKEEEEDFQSRLKQKQKKETKKTAKEDNPSSLRRHLIFASQETIEKLGQEDILDSANGILGEDKMLVHILKQQGRYGYQIYLFEAEYGGQARGGCWDFRDKTEGKKHAKEIMS